MVKLNVCDAKLPQELKHSTLNPTRGRKSKLGGYSIA